MRSHSYMWTLLHRWNVVGHFSEGFSKGSCPHFMCSLSSTHLLELSVSFPPERSYPCPGHILYFSFPFYEVHPLFSHHITNIPVSSRTSAAVVLFSPELLVYITFGAQ